MSRTMFYLPLCVHDFLYVKVQYVESWMNFELSFDWMSECMEEEEIYLDGTFLKTRTMS